MNKDIGETSDGYHTFNELYEHRHMLFMALCHTYTSTSWKSKLHDDGSEMKGWFIAGVVTPKGKTITYHLPMRLWKNFKVSKLVRAPKWDGHTSNDVLKRLKHFSPENL